ncbi:MAG TPA: LPS assembly lipoprotein LptE [Gammaproteobacteria bacterium]|nr:LPS assembly lipoprotein LptE [Gammaproteobacteria bacterium]
MVFAFLFIAACGWRLQGAYTFPPQMAKTYIDVNDPYSQLARDLTRSLSGSERVTVVQNREAATAVLHIITDRQGKRVLSVSTSGLAREYEVYYVVQYELLDSEGEVLLPPQQHLLTRQYLYDQSDILSKNREADMLIDSMRQDMVRLMLRRLAAVE